MKSDRALDRWVNLKSSAQETKKRLKMLHLSFEPFAVRAAAPLLLEPFPGSCFRFLQVPRESPFVAELFIEISLFLFSKLQSHDIALALVRAILREHLKANYSTHYRSVEKKIFVAF